MTAMVWPAPVRTGRVRIIHPRRGDREAVEKRLCCRIARSVVVAVDIPGKLLRLIKRSVAQVLCRLTPIRRDALKPADRQCIGAEGAACQCLDHKVQHSRGCSAATTSAAGQNKAGHGGKVHLFQVTAHASKPLSIHAEGPAKSTR
ncbi:hypothetical protein ABWH93_15625 [Seohaeicola saemankumensis]|uniref:hypothetical protein n=1 Tax=Seohaeicola TaxID=481178 RepID=UPI0035CF3230